MKELDWFGHWGYGFIALGMWFLHEKDPRGWAIRLFGELVWTWIGIMLGMTSIWMWGLAFMAIDIRGYVKWQAEEKAKLDFEKAQADWIAQGGYAPGIQAIRDELGITDEDMAIAQKAINETKKRQRKTGKPRSRPKTSARTVKSRRKKVSKVQGKIRQASRNGKRSVRRVSKKMPKM